MELHFVYFGKRDSYPPLTKSFRLPDTVCGALAIDLKDGGQVLEIARIIETNSPLTRAVEVLRPTGSGFAKYEDLDDLRAEVVERKEGLNHIEFRDRLNEYAECQPRPAPVQIALFAYRLANELDLDFDDLSKHMQTAEFWRNPATHEECFGDALFEEEYASAE